MTTAAVPRHHLIPSAIQGFARSDITPSGRPPHRRPSPTEYGIAVVQARPRPRQVPPGHASRFAIVAPLERRGAGVSMAPAGPPSANTLVNPGPRAHLHSRLVKEFSCLVNTPPPANPPARRGQLPPLAMPAPKPFRQAQAAVEIAPRRAGQGPSTKGGGAGLGEATPKRKFVRIWSMSSLRPADTVAPPPEPTTHHRLSVAINDRDDWQVPSARRHELTACTHAQLKANDPAELAAPHAMVPAA